jgi:gamma-glutamyltranspeptidase/glutathione hydrolase
MAPTIVLRDGKPYMAIGTPGGGRIITAVVHALVNVIDYGMNIQEAIDAPRFHQQWLPEETAVEPRAIPPDARRILESWGHRFREVRSMNHMTGIVIEKGRFYGANDPRGETGLALGY